MWARPEALPCYVRLAAPAPPPPRLALLLQRSGGSGDALTVERELLARAAAGGAHAAVWEPEPSLVVPCSYRRFERFEPLCRDFAERGWPVSVRRSGGGLVPQGPGLLNLSLAWRTRCAMGEAMEAVYEGLCALLQRAVRPFGLGLRPQAVEGSFCDGRFNLALQGRKVAGTAQCWQRAGAHEHLVLAHACVLVEADLATLVQLANEFEAGLGSAGAYRVDALANLVPGHGARPMDRDGVPLSAATLAARLAAVLEETAALC